MKTKMTEQAFLDDLTLSGRSVAIYLTSGIRLLGQMAGSDSEVVFLRPPSPRTGNVQMIMKTAIATIATDG